MLFPENHPPLCSCRPPRPLAAARTLPAQRQVSITESVIFPAKTSTTIRSRPPRPPVAAQTPPATAKDRILHVSCFVPFRPLVQENRHHAVADRRALQRLHKFHLRRWQASIIEQVIFPGNTPPPLGRPLPHPLAAARTAPAALHNWRFRLLRSPSECTMCGSVGWTLDTGSCGSSATPQDPGRTLNFR